MGCCVNSNILKDTDLDQLMVEETKTDAPGKDIKEVGKDMFAMDAMSCCGLFGPDWTKSTAELLNLLKMECDS